MKIFDKDQFISLSRKSGFPFISIFTPTSRLSTTAYKDDKIHFKNQLQEINSRLTSEKGLAWKEAERILDPAQRLLDKEGFWEHNSDMLALFLHDGEMEVFQLPLEVQESSHFIGSKPMLLPLIPELSDDGHYYLLLLNLDHIYLYEATRNGIQEIDEEGIDSSFTEEESEGGEKGFQARGGVGMGSQFHGHSENSDEERKKRLLHFFQKVNNKLVPVLNRNPLPLYLAGVEYLAPIFREANSYGYLMEGKITGAFNHNDIMILHAKSWEVAGPYFETERLERKSSFGSYLANGLAINNDKLKLIKAALTGAVDTLLVR
jgi:hypothetical protein